jgi:protein-L-isoaspartate(D-aspartate) O-methyltransferase
MKDTARHIGLRRNLLEELRKKGITDSNVLAAMMKIPRHLLVQSALDEQAYLDKALPIGEGQTISQPYTVGFQTQLLNLSKGMKVLEIGTGSGYQAAVLSAMGCQVFSIERIKTLYYLAMDNLKKLGQPLVKVKYGDGNKGWQLFKPYDRIIVTAGATEVPSELLSQLKIGGILVIPLGDNATQTMISIERIDEKTFIKKECGVFSFVPFVDGVR